MDELLFLEKIEGFWAEKIRRNGHFIMDVQHCHNEFEIYYLIEGNRQYFIEDRTYQLAAGGLIFINRGMIHNTMPDGSDRHERLLFSVSPAFFRPIQEFLGYPALSPLLSRKSLILQLYGPPQEELQQLLFGIVRELKNRGPLYQERIRLQTADLFAFLVRCETELESEHPPVKSPRHQKVYEVLQYLSAHSDTPCTLAELAKLFFIEKTYLCHIFKEITGLTIREYLNSIRIRNAQAMLSQQARSITEISQAAGYSSVTHFERVFRESTGFSPREYRAKQKIT